MLRVPSLGIHRGNLIVSGITGSTNETFQPVGVNDEGYSGSLSTRKWLVCAIEAIMMEEGSWGNDSVTDQFWAMPHVLRDGYNDGPIYTRSQCWPRRRTCRQKW